MICHQGIKLTLVQVTGFNLSALYSSRVQVRLLAPRTCYTIPGHSPTYKDTDVTLLYSLSAALSLLSPDHHDLLRDLCQLISLVGMPSFTHMYCGLERREMTSTAHMEFMERSGSVGVTNQDGMPELTCLQRLNGCYLIPCDIWNKNICIWNVVAVHMFNYLRWIFIDSNGMFSLFHL